MKVADAINEDINFNKAITPIDKKLKEDPTPFELSTMHDTLINMLGKSKAIYKVAHKAYELAIDGNVAMIKYFLSCRGGWSEKLQIIEDNKIDEKQEYIRQIDLALQSMTKDEIEEYQNYANKMVKMMKTAKTRKAS